MWEWQSLLQITHLCVVSGPIELLPSFLRARLSAAASIYFVWNTRIADVTLCHTIFQKSISVVIMKVSVKNSILMCLCLEIDASTSLLIADSECLGQNALCTQFHIDMYQLN